MQASLAQATEQGRPPAVLPVDAIQALLKGGFLCLIYSQVLQLAQQPDCFVVRLGLHALDQGENLGPRFALTLGQGFQFSNAFGLSFFSLSSQFAFVTFLSFPHKLTDRTPG